MRLLLAAIILLACGSAANADNAVFTRLKTVSAAELNAMLDGERTHFLSTSEAHPEYVLPPAATAANGIELYSVRYESVVPEQQNRKITASGLLAIPVVKEQAKLPAIIYTHGTVFGKYEVPSYAFKETNPTGFSHYDGAYEDRYMAALFGGNGYVVLAADYFGMGDGAAEPEAYFVKASTAQASYDFFRDVTAFLASKGIATSHLFVGGWSQGGLNATGLVEKLEDENVPVTAAFTASAPSDPYAALNGLMYFPRPGMDAVWLNTILALSVFSFEHYHGVPDLAKSVLAPDVYDALRAVYERSYAGPAALQALLEPFAGRPLLGYFQDSYRDPGFFAKSPYGQLLAQAETYRHMFRTPIRMFYGTRDEAIKEMVGRLGSDYQAVLIGNTADLAKNPVEAVAVPGADHRRTFISGAVLAKTWMDSLAPSP